MPKSLLLLAIVAPKLAKAVANTSQPPATIKAKPRPSAAGKK